MKKLLIALALALATPAFSQVGRPRGTNYSTATYLAPGGWGLCKYVPYTPLCNTLPADRSTWTWIATINTNAGPEVVGFTVTVTMEDGTVKSYQVQRDPATPGVTIAAFPIGDVIVMKSVTTTLLQAVESVTQAVPQ